MKEEEGQLEPPKRKLRWWLRSDKTPSQRGINAVMALGTLMAVVVAVVSIVVSSGASQSVTEIKSQTNKTVGTDNSRTTTVNNYYESGNGAPGQATPTQPDENTQLASIACGDLASNVLGGWGPDRPTFTMDNPSPFTTLDSIRNNPEFGDERGLMGVRDAASGNDGPANTWSYSTEVQPGHVYRVRMLIENSTFDGNADLAATNTKVSVSLPTCSGNRIASNGFVTSEVAYPTKIWGGVTFTSKQLFNLAYVDGSALLETNGFGSSGRPIDGTDFLTSTGQMVGYAKLDGIVQPGYQYAEYFSFEVQPQFATS